MNIKNIFSKERIFYALFLAIGLLIGWIFFNSPESKSIEHDHSEHSEEETIWTCSMHPNIRMHEPGKCPICAMDLIQLNKSDIVVDSDEIHLTKEAIELANVLTSVVAKQKPLKEVRLYGKIQADERLLFSQVSHISGRIENLLVSFTGESVSKGQPLAYIYSPDLITTQQELLEAAKSKNSEPQIYEAAKEKLRLWKLSETQISAIESSGKIKTSFEVYSSTTGIVTKRFVNNGDYVSQGSPLFEISNLSKLWALFDAYESDLPLIKEGDKVNFTVQALPGQSFVGRIAFIDPVINSVTRVSKVRLEVDNKSGKLKPEMFATGVVKANLTDYKDNIVIPRSAVLWTGKRSVVYIKQPYTDEPIFKLREIELGPSLGNSYVVISGLEVGEEIVIQGAFSVDAASQLEGKPSMMNSAGTSKPVIVDHSKH
ncbi:MAG: efflux RND transporter periplasmic adaptor subunit [Bacteroidetes bacterium HGW-Bacteroidetes-14]|jgi:Cu(I)/Ag(I) efflux system membrane fusion protein|nr:MAG: efflux RND transporter periplasmic adaptor subunit [Bacteroidetes bacterium HGW-Bacteroidetes-14]